MTFPLVLSPEELDCLRLMVRTVATMQLHAATQTFCDRVVKPGVVAEAATGAFVSKAMALTDAYRSMDLPLFHAAVLHPGKTAVVNLTDNGYETLRGVAERRFEVGPNPDAETQRFVDRLLTAQPAILAAFDVAKEQAQAKVEPNVRPDMSRN